MRVTQIMFSKGFGGAERSFVDLSLELASRGYSVQAICQKEFVETNQLSKSKNIHLEQISVAGWWDIIAVNRVLSLIKQYQPDVVQAHLARGAYIAGKATRRLGVPLVVKTHNYVSLKYYKNVDVFVATTEDQRNYLQNNGIDKRNVERIPNFSTLAPLEMASTQSILTYVSYGRMVKEKGFDILIHAFAELIKRGINARLIIGGDGPELQTLKNLVDTLDLSDRIQFYGWVTNASEFLGAADVFVLPSLKEAFGIAILEAMACHRAIVSTRCKGPVQLLNEETAYLADVQNVESLTKALYRSAIDSNERNSKADKAVSVYKRTYHSDVVVPQYMALYRNIVEAMQ